MHTERQRQKKLEKKRRKRAQKKQALRKLPALGAASGAELLIMGRRPMSEVLGEFAQPLIQHLQEQDDFFDENKSIRNAVTLAALVWNAAYLAQKSQDPTLLTKVNEQVAALGGTATYVTGPWIRRLADLRLKNYGDDPRLVLSTETTVYDDYFHITATYAL